MKLVLSCAQHSKGNMEFFLSRPISELWEWQEALHELIPPKEEGEGGLELDV